MVAVWNEATLPTLLSNYGLENIYKFGLFYQYLPENPISWKQRHVQVVHTTKPGSLVWQLLTLLAINCLCLLLVKKKFQGILKTLTKFPVDIDHKERPGWVVFYFEEWVRDVNQKFQAEGRKLVLIIDNCPGHPIIENLPHIKLVFLPPNITSLSQPMDQSIIRCLKAHYRILLM